MKRYEWTEEAIALLGTMPDRKLAEKLGVSYSTVRDRRIKEGIARSDNKKRHFWTAEEVCLLGTDTDQRIAAKLGLKTSQVTNKRISEGVHAFSARTSTKDTALQYEHLLGKDTDEAVASKIGVSAARVGQLRSELGIPSYRKSKSFDWSKSDDALLGEMPDMDVAKRMGVSVTQVFQRRHLLGIDAHRRRSKSSLERKSAQVKFPSWAAVVNMEQPIFFEAMNMAYMAQHGEKLTYSKVSSVTHWSVSRLQKWFTSGSAQKPLKLPVRHHIYISIKELVCG